MDAADAAIDPMSGLTSQPNLGRDRRGPARHAARHRAVDREPLARVADYWEAVRAASTTPSRATCAPAPPRSTSTRCRAASTPTCASRRGRSASSRAGARWRRAYADVNRLFGDIVKVTPTSKVVGDLAVFMVTNDLTPEQVLDPDREIAFPDSVVEFFHGDLGQPYGGFPEALQREGAEGRAAAHACAPARCCRRPTSTRPAPRPRRRCAAT